MEARGMDNAAWIKEGDLPLTPINPNPIFARPVFQTEPESLFQNRVTAAGMLASVGF